MPKAFAVQKSGSVLPKVRFKTVRDTDKHSNAVKLFEYWDAVKPEFAELVEVRIYRLWPVCDLKFVEPERKTIEVLLIEGAIPFEPDDYKKWFLENPALGSGEWKVLLNEKGVKGELMEAYFSAIDLEAYPPKIDYRTLIRGHHRNSDFLRWLGRQNVNLPWEEEEIDPEQEQEREETEMMNESIAELARQNVELAKEVTAARSTAQPSVAPVESVQERTELHASNRAIDMMTGATEQVVKMVTDNVGPQLNILEVMDKAQQIAERSHSSNGDGGLGMSKLLVETMQSSNDRVIAVMEKSHQQTLTLLERFTAPPAQTALVPAGPPKGELETLLESGEKLKRLENIFGGGGRRRDSDEPAPKSQGFFGNLMEYASQNPQQALMGLTTVMALATNLVLSFTGKGMKPEEAIARANGAAPDGQPPQGQPQPQPQPQKPWQVMFVENFTGPFLAHLYGDGTDGYTLAEFIIGNGLGAGPTPDGRKMYDSVKENLGPRIVNDRQVFPLFDLMRNFPPLWQRLSDASNPAVPANPIKLEAFFNEFFNYDEELIRRQQEEDTVSGTRSATRGNAPVV